MESCPPGGWRKNDHCTMCIEPEWCLGGENNTCAEGRDGFACGDCAWGYFLYESECHECPSKSLAFFYWGVTAFAVIFGVYLIFSGKFSDGGTTFAIGSAHFQMTYVYFHLPNLVVPKTVLFVSNIFGIAVGYVFDVVYSRSGPECIWCKVPPNPNPD